MAAPKPGTALAEAIRTGRFDPAYALCGENEFRKEEALRQVIDSATDATTRDFNLDVIRGPEADSLALELALNGLPMMAERRVVVIRDASSLKKQALARLEEYLANPSATTLLFLIYPADAEVPSAIARQAVTVELEQLSGDRLLKWVMRQAKTAHRTEITRAATELLLETIGSDLLELDGELDKLASYTEGREIDADDVAEVVGVKRGETVVSLLEAVSQRDVQRAVALVPAVLRQPKVTGVTLVMSLAAQLLGIGWSRARRDAGASQSHVQREGFAVARRVPQFMDPRSPSERVGAWVRASTQWTLADVDTALGALLAADVALKQTRVASEEQIVSTAVLAACAGAERASAAA